MSGIMYIHVRRHNRNGCRKKEYFSDANRRNYALYINIKANRNKLSKTNSSYKSGKPYKQGVPGLSFLLCYYFATKRNYSVPHHFIVACIFQTIFGKLNNFSLGHRDNFSQCCFLWQWRRSVWKSCIGAYCI